MNLNKEEAVWFVTKVLGIVSLKNLQEDRMLFLNEIIQAVHRSVSFQNITLLSQAEEERHRPTLEEIKSSMMSGFGGLCYTIGVFVVHLLRALGYDAYIASASIHAYPDNHVIAIVQNVTSPGSKHLVDAWTGWPTFQTIPLDFEEESPTYNYSFLEFKFVKKSGNILRFHRKGNKYTFPRAGGCESSGPEQWKMVCEVDLTPREISHFDHSMNELYTKPGVGSPFLVSFRAVNYQGKDMKLVALKNTELYLENDSPEVEVKKLKSREEMVAIMKRYFPQFTVDDVTRAIDSLHFWDHSGKV